MRSTTIGIVVPIQLLDWIDKTAESVGLTRSRYVAQMLLEASGLDLELAVQGRSLNTAKKQATSEIAKATGQIPIGKPNFGW